MLDNGILELWIGVQLCSYWAPECKSVKQMYIKDHQFLTIILYLILELELIVALFKSVLSYFCAPIVTNIESDTKDLHILN